MAVYPDFHIPAFGSTSQFWCLWEAVVTLIDTDIDIDIFWWLLDVQPFGWDYYYEMAGWNSKYINYWNYISVNIQRYSIVINLRRLIWGLPILYQHFQYAEKQILTFFFCGVEWDWVHLVCRPLTDLLYQPRMIDECGGVGGIRINKGNRSTAPVLLCPLQIPHDLTWARTLAAALGSRQLTAWAMARP
jgi:hypothetical protein